MAKQALQLETLRDRCSHLDPGVIMQNMWEVSLVDHAIWRRLCERQTQLSQGKASSAFVQGLQKIEFSPDAIPSFAALTKKIKPLTGWEIVPVTGLLPTMDFFALLAERKLPTTVWIRNAQELVYIEEPDLFHDVFGHVPILTNKEFTQFVEGFAKLCSNHIDNPNAIELLSRIWWFTFEFGLIKEGSATKIFGGGILSSKGEVGHSLSDVPIHVPFDVATVMHTPFEIDRMQNLYFVINSFSQLLELLPEIEKCLNDMLEGGFHVA
jgi:phenylalanine-4-hydroxylase